MTDLQKELFKLRDEKYREFHKNLIPTVDADTVIGIRAPALRAFAKEYYKRGEVREFLHALPHKYYEENNLHAFLIEQIKDFDTALAETERFVHYIDNWATCDCFLPKVFVKNADRLLPNIKRWIASDETYTVRYAVDLLMKVYLDGNYKKECMELVAGVSSGEYYVNMGVAWYFATALAKQYDDALFFIESHALKPWVHNKSIQKATESRRIPPETKEHLKRLKV